MTKPTAAFPEPISASSGATPPDTGVAPAEGLGPNPSAAELAAFFRAPAPPGRSRESRIVLDAEGRFSQDGAPFEHAKLAQAFHRWIGRHPDDGRYILSNGLDWSYFTVEDAPFFVRQLVEKEGALLVILSDDSQEPLDPAHCRIGSSGAVYMQVKHGERGGPFEAKFTRHAQTALAPHLEESAEGVGLRVGGGFHRIGRR